MAPTSAPAAAVMARRQAEKLGLPYLNAYLDSIGTNFRHGANFATGGSTIQPVGAKIYGMGFSPISLDIQLLQFEQFKERTIELYKQGGSSYIKSSLPRPEDFSNALYTLDIGQNDLHGFTNPLEFCCGGYGNDHVACGKKAIVNGTEVFGASCSNPSVYISWDSIHYSHAANKWVANQILNGNHSDPPVPITKACRKQSPL
ncbi:hypothetical protein FH972_009229 [Carpinus fangiana]|uniref:Uncharacterized protein n=1 Tax=Carpinus fangiana TaxID=176857 RepID=A0A5N6R184_9ROSI|nr:hypothetical protein FH972_009229 [Carpinus fangiana]